MHVNELNAADFRRISAITKEIGLHKGKGYSEKTVKAVLQTGTRTNLEISTVANIYMAQIENLKGSALDSIETIRKIAREEAEKQIKKNQIEVTDLIAEQLVDQLKKGVLHSQSS